MDKSYFMELLNRYLAGTATVAETEFLLDYYEMFESEQDVLDLLSSSDKTELSSEIRNNIREVIDQRKSDPGSDISKRGSSRRLWLIRGAVAAAILLVMSIGIQFLRMSPGKSNVIISRSEQSKEHRLIRLPDGSTVIVSSGSKLNYPSSFDGSARREVYLEGQAYFDIKHNASKPFIIHTGKVSTTVLGTAFNIKAWPSSNDVTVTVARGKVKVEDDHKILGVITPNQQITYNKINAAVVQQTVDTHDYLSWKDQDLLLDDVTVAEASELLELRFKVKILIRDEQMGTKRFTTTFLRGEDLERVLKSICEFNGASYSYNKEKGQVILSSK